MTTASQAFSRHSRMMDFHVKRSNELNPIDFSLVEDSSLHRENVNHRTVFNLTMKSTRLLRSNLPFSRTFDLIQMQNKLQKIIIRSKQIFSEDSRAM